MARKKRKRLVLGWRRGWWGQYELSPDDPTADRAEYDETVNVAPLCPMCDCCRLEFDDYRKADGYKWWCSGCESYIKDADVKKNV